MKNVFDKNDQHWRPLREVHSPDHSFELNITAPGKRVENATNPEQLFAAGFSACFNSALELVKATKESTVLRLSVHK